MAGNPFPRGLLAEGLQMCAEGSKSTWRSARSFLTSQAAGALLLTACCHLLYFFTLAWIWSQSVKIFSRIQTRRNFTKRALSEAMSTDRAWKDQMERLEAVKGPAEAAEMNGSESMIHECIHPLIPVSVSVSDSHAKQKVLKTPEMVDAMDVKLEQRASLLQSKVELNSQTMSLLRNLAVDCSKDDKKFTVQLSRWRLFIHTPGGVKMLKLDDAHKVPTIRHASYAAGKLTIEGFNFEGAEIKAATFNKCITLKNLTKEEVGGGLQIWTCITRLPSNNLREVFVCATKPICIEEHDVIVRSSVTGVQDHNLRIVLRVGIPSTIGLIYMVLMYVKLFSLEGWRFADPAIAWTLPLMAMAVTQILPQSTEDAIEVCIDRIGLAAVSLFTGARSLIFKPHPALAGRTIPPLALALAPSLPSAQKVDCEEQEESMDHKKKPEKIRRSFRGGKPPKSDKPKRKDSDGETEEEPQCLVYEEYADEFGRISVRKRAPQSEDPKRRPPFKFIHGLKSKLWVQRDHFKFYADTVLVEVLRKFLPEKFNFMGSNKVIVYAAEFFPFRYELKQSLDSIAAEMSVNLDQAQADQVKAHLQYFWQFFDTSCHEVSDRYEAMKKEGSVSWDMLWAFFPPDTKVAYRCAITGEEVCATAQTIDYDFCSPDRIPKFIIGLKTWDYNCRTWTSYSTFQRRIAEYPGHCDLASLATHPLEFKTNPLQAENRFLAKGRWFCELSMLAGNRFMQYEGLMYVSTREGVTKDAVSGRVMIGLASFAKMNPDYPLLTASPPNDHRHGPSAWGSKLDPSRNSGFCGTSSSERLEKKRELIDFAGGQLRTNQPELINISEREDRMFAPTIVYGFSFQLKKWGAFNIDGFEDIVFNESAYESLVMDSKLKDTIYSLVHEYKQSDDSRRDTPRERVDPIVGKGEGCILLCYGPPGTGKTFTAESISEKLHAPLWSLSVSELGTTPAVLEKKLVRILDVAASWGAVLLLDEADVYLEKRDTGTMDLERNAMTGIFLRNLEYYKGVLFLTTNRVVAFDDAFCSRISMFLYYEKHSEGDRRTVWKNLLKPLQVKDLEAFLETDYASFELNAREIRNVVQVARTLAKTKGEELSGVFLRHSLETLAASLLQLRQVTGEKHTSSFGSAPPST